MKSRDCLIRATVTLVTIAVAGCGSAVPEAMQASGNVTPSTNVAPSTVQGGVMTHSEGNVTLGTVQGVLNHSDAANLHPGLITLPDGNLLASYDSDHTDVFTQLSTDSGRTWSAPVNAYTGPVGSLDLTNLSMLNFGEVWLTFDETPAGGLNILMGLSGSLNATDDITWSKQFVVDYDSSLWTASCNSGGPVVQLRNGDLLFPAYCGQSPLINYSSTVFRSTDSGTTWTQTIVGNAQIDGRDYDESALAVMPSGDIVMIMRHTDNLSADTTGTYWRSVSTDGGLTWSKPVEALNVTNVSRPTLAVIPGGGLVLMGRSALVDSTGFATSWDEGLTFTPMSPLGVTGPGLGIDQYDAMSLLPDQTVAVVTTHGTGFVNVDYRNLIPPSSQ
jgi:BNR repeat-like domain